MRFFIALLFCIISAPALACTLDDATGTTIDAKPYLSGGYGARWNAANNRLAYMTPDESSGYYKIVIMSPDGTKQLIVPDVSGGHQGAAYWHPTGKYLMFTAQQKNWHGRKMFGNPDYEALPGYGRHDDIWLTTADGRKQWQLTTEAVTKDEGALIPVFSPEGKRIAWSARQPGGKYAIEVADFIKTPQPHLGKPQEFQPGGAAYYEPGSFTSDGSRLIYTSDQDSRSFWHSQLYSLDLASGKSARLTDGNDYNEHPTVIKTAGGDWIVYMSTKGVKRIGFHFMLGTDWYAMRTDGSAVKRLTTMNLPGKDNPEFTGKSLVAGTVAVSPDGSYMIGDVQDDLMKQTGFMKIIRFTCH